MVTQLVTNCYDGDERVCIHVSTIGPSALVPANDTYLLLAGIG